MRSKTLWTAFALTALVLVAFSAQAGDHEYVGAAKCKMCHKVQFASWETTTHAKATDSAKASTDREFSADCLQCHATNASEDLPGVQCEACHGPGGDYKKMSIMKDAEAAKANGLVIPTQATCDGCHTGDDHAKKVVLADNLNNKAAIHEFKNPPGE
jgi:nitrate/TMAO reductase-like tetraheme cytochrome c subunit